MKKTLIASAIAAATFSGSVLAQESNLPTVYGNIQYAAVWDNFDGGPSDFEHRDNGSTIGFMHDHMITPDLEGFFKVEMDRLGADDIETRDSFRIDEAYIGVRGDNFGQFWVGSDDSTYERATTIISEYYEAADLSQSVSYTTGEGDLVQYMSPSFGGLSIWGAVEINGDGDSQNTTGENEFPWQLAAVYTTGMFELAAAIDSNDNSVGENENTYGLRGTANLDSLSLTAEYHTRKDVQDTYGVMGVYTLGANRFALSYERTEEDFGDELDYDTITLQALHNLSDNMYVYVEGYLGGGDNVYGYNAIDTDGDGENDAFADFTDERSVAAVGAVYYF
ncbi:porin [Marinobacter segnicrescens]|uniref:porin n=1 Tax=Marinobacter segnicrescens TaxID=430453 RepID=UPI003A8F8411